jgi:hypothetical protein
VRSEEGKRRNGRWRKGRREEWRKNIINKT